MPQEGIVFCRSFVHRPGERPAGGGILSAEMDHENDILVVDDLYCFADSDQVAQGDCNILPLRKRVEKVVTLSPVMDGIAARKDSDQVYSIAPVGFPVPGAVIEISTVLFRDEDKMIHNHISF